MPKSIIDGIPRNVCFGREIELWRVSQTMWLRPGVKEELVVYLVGMWKIENVYGWATVDSLGAGYCLPVPHVHCDHMEHVSCWHIYLIPYIKRPVFQYSDKSTCRNSNLKILFSLAFMRPSFRMVQILSQHMWEKNRNYCIQLTFLRLFFKERLQMSHYTSIGFQMTSWHKRKSSFILNKGKIPTVNLNGLLNTEYKLTRLRQI